MHPSQQRRIEANTLVEAAKSGQPGAFAELFRRYRPRIYALALHLTGSADEAEDVTQDAFLKAYQYLHRFEGRSEFFTWLYRIALHRALNHQRRKKRERTVDVLDPRLQRALEVDTVGDPGRRLELRETYIALLHAFDALSPLLQTTLVLTALQGLSHQEAAVVLETSEGTISWRIHEARRKMRKTIDKLTRSPIRRRGATPPQSLLRWPALTESMNRLMAAFATTAPTSLE